MTPEIIKVYQERLPACRFIGKCYTNADCQGGFGHKWGEWFANGWFELLEKLGKLENVDNGSLGLMRCDMFDFDNTFEYWIGMFLPVGTLVPEGFAYIYFAESELAICWIKGKESEGLYGMHDACMEKIQELGWDNFMVDEQNRNYFFERYNCPRFTVPDDQGKVILDYGVFLEK